MTTTAQQIVDRAKAFSALNTPLTTDRGEMLSRIRADQRAVFARIAQHGAARFQSTAAVTSSSAASARTASLASLTPPLGRILHVAITSSGAKVRQAEVGDEDAKFAPRYIARALTLVEVGSDWSTSTGTVALTLTYVQGPTDIDPTGAYSQTVSVPDEWTDLLVLSLAMYLHQKDPGRDPAEFQRLQQWYATRLAEFDAYCLDYDGPSPHVGQTGAPA